MDTLLWILSIVLITAGIAGTVLPVLPGTGLILAGMALAAWIDNFTRIGGWTLALLTGLAVLGWLTDYVAGMLGAKKAGASKQALVGAAIGTVLGIFMGLIGVLFMPLVGAAVGEYLARRDERRALHVGVATWVGLLIGMAAKVGLAFMMVGVFVVALMF